MEEAGQHEERPRPTRPQRSSSDLLWRTHPTGGDRAEGAATQREEVDETGNGVILAVAAVLVMRNGSRNVSMRMKTKDVETS